MVADGILAIGDVDGLVWEHLYVLAVEDEVAAVDVHHVDVAVVLVGDHILDAGLTRIEVIAQLLHIVDFATFRHHGPSLPVGCKGIVYTVCVNHAGGHVIVHPFGGQLHILVFDLYISIIMY